MHFAEGELKRPRISPLYRIGVLMVCAAMIFLPAIYAGLIALTVFGTLAGAILLAVALISDFTILGILLVFPLYLLVIASGGLLGLFLIKPLFAPRRKPPEVFLLEHADAPELFALIGWICRSLGTPMPGRVELNCGVNAGASLGDGWRKFFGNEIALSIGLPLAAGLNLSQLAGVIAHEYGHLSQGAAMRADFLITRINLWFCDAVYVPDEWDVYLREQCHAYDQDWKRVFLFYFLRAGIAVGRGVLWVFMVTGNLFSSFLSRQMEFDADQYELKISGSETFVSTTLRLQQLSLGLVVAQKQMVAKWKKDRKLVDRIPDYIVARANEIPADAQEQFYARVFRRKTRMFDRHPSDAERTARARAVRELGVLRDSSPATGLFADYPELSRRLTAFFYRDLIGPGFSVDALVSLEERRARAEHDHEADRANVRRHFLGIATDSRPLLLEENKSLTCRPEYVLTAEIFACQKQMVRSVVSARDALAAFTDAETRLWQAGQAAQLLAAGFQFDPADFAMEDNDVEGARSVAEADLRRAAAELEIFETAGKLRLVDAVQLLPLPLAASRIAGAVKLQDEAREMVHVLSRLAEIFGPLGELRRDCVMLEILLAYRRCQPAADNAATVLENLCVEIQERVNAIQEHTGQIRYPFDHATEQVMLNEFLRNKEYQADPMEQMLRESKCHVEKLLDLYNRLLGNLVVICEGVEKNIGAGRPGVDPEERQMSKEESMVSRSA